MAKIWFVHEGPRKTRGGPGYELSVDDCETQLGLSQESFISTLDKTPEFDDTSGLGAFAGYKHVVVEVGDAEANLTGWQPGFYRLQLSPTDVANKLGQPRQGIQ